MNFCTAHKKIDRTSDLKTDGAILTFYRPEDEIAGFLKFRGAGIFYDLDRRVSNLDIVAMTIFILVSDLLKITNCHFSAFSRPYKKLIR